MPSAWTPTYITHEGDIRLVDKISQMSDGAFDLKLFTAGELVGAFDVFDVVADGTVECGSECPIYWGGKNTAFGLIGAIPMYFTQPDHLMWYFEGGGKELADELYGKYNMRWFPIQPMSIEAGIQTHVPINKLEDLKGLKIRMGPKLGLYAMEQVGAEAVSMPTGDIYEAMQRGVLDGFEAATLGNNFQNGFHEVSEYINAPAWWQPTSISGVCVNLDAWNALSGQMQAIFENACYACTVEMMNYISYKEIEGLQQHLDYGIEITHFGAADMVKVEAMVAEYMEGEAAANPDYAKMAKSQMDFLKAYEGVRDFAAPFSWGFNAEQYPDIP